MREIQLPLNQTQKIRLQRALDKLESLSSNSNSNASVTVADTIPVNLEDQILRGHGTLEHDGQVVATLCGVVERVNKLVYVRSLRSRYKPETGDIIVGRVVEVTQKRWRIDINSNQDAVLMLSSVTLPDGIQKSYESPATIIWQQKTNPLPNCNQRRRTPIDELNMRNIFEENDVISAEVRNLQHDGTLQLQARSDKYGKLDRGQLIAVPSYLIKRRKQHFHPLKEYGVLLILGCNGYVWVGELIETRDSMDVDQVHKSEQKSTSYTNLEAKEEVHTPLEARQKICRIANSIRVLSILGFNITIEVIKEICDLSTSRNIDIHDMFGAEFCVLVAENEADRRSTGIKKKG